MVAVAPDPNTLANRVRYFVKKERANDIVLSELLEEMASPCYLFGGVVRDLAVYGKRDLADREADIDIVCAAPARVSRMFFDGLESREGVEKNRFGGLRFITDRWRVDIWPARDTWAFREGKVRYDSIESLLKTTITNWEAVLFRLDGGPLICRPRYFEDIRSGYLDVVLSDNPNQLGMYVRLFRACIDWPVFCLSNRTRKVLRKAIVNYSLQELKSYEKEHYRRLYIEEGAYGQVAEAVLADGSGRARIGRGTVTDRSFRNLN